MLLRWLTLTLTLTFLSRCFCAGGDLGDRPEEAALPGTTRPPELAALIRGAQYGVGGVVRVQCRRGLWSYFQHW